MAQSISNSFLSEIVDQQSSYYGMTPEKHAKMLQGVSEYQELIDSHEIEEPQGISCTF